MGMEPSWKNTDAAKFTREMKGIFKETEAVLKRAADEMKRYYDRGQRLDNLKVGDKVWLDTSDLQTDRPSKKLNYKRVGPFEITAKHGKMAYKLVLPSSYKVHPVFPMVKLAKAMEDEWKRPILKIKLKVWDPATGEFINLMEKEDPKGIKLDPEMFTTIRWRLNLDQYPNTYTTSWTHRDNED